MEVWTTISLEILDRYKCQGSIRRLTHETEYDMRFALLEIRVGLILGGRGSKVLVTGECLQNVHVLRHILFIKHRR